jgi:hypothetical protein
MYEQSEKQIPEINSGLKALLVSHTLASREPAYAVEFKGPFYNLDSKRGRS